MCWSQFIFHATPRLWGHKFIQLILTPAWQKIVDRLVYYPERGGGDSAYEKGEDARRLA